MPTTIHHRRSIRLPEFDYSQSGAYFITIVTQNRRSLFGDIKDDELKLNEIGEMIKGCWLNLLGRFPMVTMDEFIVMPNHFHGIIIMTDGMVGSTLVVDPTGVGTSPTPTPTRTPSPTLGDIIMAFKSITTNEYIRGVKQSGWPAFNQRVWQRNYYEHIIRNDMDFQRVRDYICSNPLRWGSDEENPQKR